jgi:adenine-specific DNA-methyltransferase
MFDADVQVMHSVSFSYAQTAATQFADIFDGKKTFDNPKSYTDLERLVGYLSEPGDTVLDFFAGSGSSFHGLVRTNADESTPRKMIAVQFPEPVIAGGEAANNALSMGLDTIAEIARERMRRLFRLPEHKAERGFRAFKLTPSNIMRWTGVEHKDPDTYAAQLEAFNDSLAPGWKPLDVIWEIALREGYTLTAKVEKLDIDTGPTFWSVSDEDRSFTICLDNALTLDAVAPLALTRDNMFVCRDTALDDTLAANLALQCRLKVI